MSAGHADHVRLKELIEKRMRAWEAMKGIVDQAQGAGGAMTGEHETAWHRADAEYQLLDEEIAVEERKQQTASEEREREERLREQRTSAGRRSVPAPIGEPPPRGSDGANLEVRSSSGRRLKPHELRRNDPAHRANHLKYLTLPTMHEVRALQMDSDILGGYLVPPQQFMDELILNVKNYTFIRDMARVITVDRAQSLGIPTLEVDVSAPLWTTEIASSAAANDTSMQFGKRELAPSDVVKQILISNKLLSMSPNVEDIVKDRIAYQYAVLSENAFLTGSGVNQPLGVFTASTLAGISTGRDTATASSSAIVGDDLITCVYSLKAQYQNSAKTCWIMSRYVASLIRKIKDSQNRYMWEPSIQIGQPPTLLNYPIRMSEYAPSQTELEASTYVAILGDFSHYYIAEVEGDEGMTIQRLDELFAQTNQTGYIMRAKLDGMPVLQEAFARLIMHS